MSEYSLSEAVKTLTLEKMQYRWYHRLSGQVALNDPDMSIIADHLSDDFVAKFDFFLWGERVRVIERRVYKTWWDFLRADHFPAWANKRWPPRYELLRLEAKAIYPTFALAHPGMEYRVLLTETRL